MTLSPSLLKRLRSAPPREADTQRAIAAVLDLSRLTWMHVPNEASWLGGVRRMLIGILGPEQGQRVAAQIGQATGRSDKKNGLKAGAPDIMVFEPFGDIVIAGDVLDTSARFAGLAIELKAGRNKATAEQLQWHEKLRACGWRVEVCYSTGEALEVLKECYPRRIG